MRYNYAIELGGASTTIFAREEGFVLKEPTLVAVETSTEGYKVKAVGEEAKKTCLENSGRGGSVQPNRKWRD